MLKNFQTEKRRFGFTLVELVMVIVIIGIMAAIIVPRFASQRDQAAISTTKANLENLRTAIALYYAEEGDWPLNTLVDLTNGSTGHTYLRAIPEEAITSSNSVVNTNNGNGGWAWNEDSEHEVHPNLTDDDVNGDAYAAY